MKWRSKIKTPLKDGDVITQKRFAWYPIKLDDGVTVWLELYYCERMLMRMHGFEDTWLTLKQYQL